MDSGPGPASGALAEPDGQPLSGNELTRVRRWVGCLARPDLTDAEARPVAARLAEVYRRLGPRGRGDYLRVLAQTCAAPSERRLDGLRGLLGTQRLTLLKRFNLIDGGLRFLIDLRAHCFEAVEPHPELALVESELEALLAAWFDVGLLDFRRISWDSPASLLEKLVKYEAVHAIRSWDDLRNRLEPDRRCYAFFHPRLPDEPLIFVEVAFADSLAADIPSLLDTSAPITDPRRSKAAIFYSISSTQRGLRGLGFGNFLLQRVMEELRRELPQLATFATLSPMPGLRRWVEGQAPEIVIEALGAPRVAALGGERAAARALRSLRDADRPPFGGPEGAVALSVAAHYLTRFHERGVPLDVVARFHLGNGASLDRLNADADPSHKGCAQSWGLMVNYRYEPRRIDRNRAMLARGRPALGAEVQSLL